MEPEYTIYIKETSDITSKWVKFNDLFPVTLTSLDFDATNTDVQYFTAQATFKYTIYNLTDLNNNSL